MEEQVAIGETPTLRVLAILSALMGFASISTDLYLPAMPVMAAALHTAPSRMALTVSSYLVGFALGQLFWGPLSDRHGRRGPIALGLCLFVIASAGCAMANGMSAMIVCRVLQALGACAGVTLGRAMVRDLYEGDRAARMMSILMTVMAIAPLLGPLLGGQILLVASWRAIFWLLVGIGLLTLGAVWTLPETLPHALRYHQPLIRAMAGYPRLLRNRRVLGYAGVGGFFFAGIFAYVGATPFAYITYYHVLPQLYGLLFAAGMIGIMTTNMLNARFVSRVGLDQILKGGACGAALAGLAAAIAARSGWGGLFGLAVPLFVFVSMTGFIVANAIVGALSQYSERAGTVSALIGAAQYGGGVIGSALAAACADDTPWPLGWVVALAGFGTLFCAEALRKASGKEGVAPCMRAVAKRTE